MPDLLLQNPSALGPKIHFGNQSVVNNAPGVFANTAENIPGPDDDAWNLVEWGQQEVLDPDAVSLDNPATYDPALGTDAVYSWQTADGETSFAAYDTPSNGWIYGLGSAGIAGNTSEQDVFLQTAPNLSINLGGGEIDYAMTARIMSEGIPPGQPTDGWTYSGAVTGFTFDYNLPGQPDYDSTQPTFSVFLQINLSSTQNNSDVLAYFSESTNASGQPTSIISDQLRYENSLLPASRSASTPETYNVSAYVSDLANYLYNSEGLGSGVTDFNRWTLNGVYVGVMAEGAGSYINLQVSNIELTESRSGKMLNLMSRL